MLPQKTSKKLWPHEDPTKQLHPIPITSQQLPRSCRVGVLEVRNPALPELSLDLRVH